MVTEFVDYHHNKTGHFINSFLPLSIHDSNCYLSATSGHAALPRVGRIHILPHEQHKEINFVITVSFPRCLRAFDVSTATLHVCFCILTEFNRQ